MSSLRAVRVLLTVLLVLVPAMVGVLAGSSVESEAAGLAGSQGARGSDFGLRLEPGDTLLSVGALGALELGAPPTHTITPDAGPGGSITPSTAVEVTEGLDQNFAIAADANYHIADVLVDGFSVGAVTSYTFSNVTAGHTISASFALTTHTITASAGPGGSITPLGAVSVNDGSSQAFTIAPQGGYHIADVLVDGSLRGRRDLLHLQQRHRRPYDQCQLRPHHPHHHCQRRPRRQHHAAWRRLGQRRLKSGFHHRPAGRLPHRRRARRRLLRRRRDLLHLQQRHRRPYDQRHLRPHHPHHHCQRRPRRQHHAAWRRLGQRRLKSGFHDRPAGRLPHRRRARRRHSPWAP